MIHKEICTYEVAKLAKEKGFDWNTRERSIRKIDGSEREEWNDEKCMYEEVYDAEIINRPTQSLLQRWLREEKGLHITVPFDNDGFWWQIKNLANGDSEYGEALGFNTYELALEDALKYALENLI